jgi:hypothetical protein
MDARNGIRGFGAAAESWRNQLQELHRLYPDKPIFATEFGYPALKGAGGAFNEQQQALCLEAEYRGICSADVCGAAVWCWADHPWPKRYEAQQITLSPYGVVTRGRVAKTALAVIARLFTEGRGDGLCT